VDLQSDAGRRAPTEKEERRRAMKADRRGGRVAPTVEEFERVAVLGSSRDAGRRTRWTSSRTDDQTRQSRCRRPAAGRWPAN
jgi:hypothetical protein